MSEQPLNEQNGAEDRSIKTDPNAEAPWYSDYTDNPEIMSGRQILDKYKTTEDLIKSHYDLEAYRGRSAKMLNADATPEEKSEFVEKFRRNGLDVYIKPNPEDAEDMQRFQTDLGVPKDGAYEVPADVVLETLDADGVELTKKVSNDLGHTQEQHLEFIKHIDALNVENQKAQQGLIAEEDAKLSQTWGDAREQNEGIVAGLVKQFEDANVPLGEINNAGKIMLLNIANAMSSDPQSFSQVQNPTNMKTPAEIEARQAELFEALTKQGGRDLGSRKKVLQKEYEQTFADLAKYKNT